MPRQKVSAAAEEEATVHQSSRKYSRALDDISPPHGRWSERHSLAPGGPRQPLPEPPQTALLSFTFLAGSPLRGTQWCGSQKVFAVRAAQPGRLGSDSGRFHSTSQRPM
eukprot:scaffold70971_cov74-Phaeocystis_antarctica.AAC.7